MSYLSIFKWAILGISIILMIQGCSSENTKEKDIDISTFIKNKQISRFSSEQMLFIDTVEKYVDDFKYIETNTGLEDKDLEKTKLRDLRKNDLRKIIPDLSVRSWTGTIKNLSADSMGNVDIILSLSKNILLKNNNTVFLNPLEHNGKFILNTLSISKNNPLHNKIFNLKEGDDVKFSGKFLKSTEDYLDEMSITTEGSMTNPEFKFEFDSIELID